MKYALIIISLIIAAFFAGNAVSTVSNPKSAPQVQGVSQEIASAPSQQFNKLLTTNEYMLLDIRTTEEYAAGHIEDAKQIDYYQTQAFSDYLDTLDKNRKYLIYCRTGNRTSATLKLMQSKGFKHVYELTGGYNAWVNAGLPIVK